MIIVFRREQARERPTPSCFRGRCRSTGSGSFAILPRSKQSYVSLDRKMVDAGRRENLIESRGDGCIRLFVEWSGY